MDQLERITFGNSGLSVPRLSLGTGTNGWQGRSDQGDLGVTQLAELLQAAYQKGVNFWDTADAYGTHPHVAKALENLPREDIVIVTKTLAQKSEPTQKDVERFLNELRTDYIDIVLLHVMTHPDWPTRYAEAMAVLTQAKQVGKIQSVGVSCHSLNALKTAAQTEWCEVVMARINYAGTNMDTAPKKVVPVLEKICAAGKAVYGMKIVGNGKIAHNTRAAIEYAFQLGTIHSMTIGIMNQSQLVENIQLIQEFSTKYPLKNRA